MNNDRLIQACATLKEIHADRAKTEEAIAVGWTILTVLSFLHGASLWVSIPLAVKAAADFGCCFFECFKVALYSRKRMALLKSKLQHEQN